MCGICGIIDYQDNLSITERENQVMLMNKAMLHRGPDDGGLYSSQSGSIAMRRLAIVDIKDGQQPMFNQSKEIGVVFNGEIYNYKNLKRGLVKRGYQFVTKSDTEVLIHLYEAFGVSMLPMIKGMFSFCLYDKNNNSYLLARDRFGEKPLFYHWDHSTFSFSSEIKSLLEHSNIERRLNQEALPYYFRTSLIPEPQTLLDKVYSLPPGHYIQLNETGLEVNTYHKLAYKKETALKTKEEAIEFIQPILAKAVQSQTIGDVRVGAFLSGGIDSSTIVALLQKESSQKIPTFNVRFEDQEFDESRIARKVAEHCGTDHHEIFIPNVDFDESIFWEIIDRVGFPFRDSSAIPSFLISKEIAQHVKVALSGDGGDELFGGYSLFQWYQKIINFKRVARPVRAAMNMGLGLARHVPGLNQVSILRQIKRGLNTSLEAQDDIPISLNEMFTREQIPDLLKGGKFPNWIDRFDYIDLKNKPASSKDWSPLRNIMFYRLQHTLPVNMLVKVDRMSMANSLEVRAPFLDPDLFEASKQIPDHLLIHDGLGKYIIREMMKSELPDEVFNHPKTGFNIPLHKYQNKKFIALAERLLFDENPWPDLIPKKQLEEIYRRGISTNKNSAKQSVFQSAHQLWMMMQLFAWAIRFNVQIN